MITKSLVLHPCKHNHRIIFRAYEQEVFTDIEAQLEYIIKLGMCEEQVKLMAEFTKTYKFHPKSVIAYGKTKNINATLLNKIIELDLKTGYTCYQRDNPTGLVKIHEDVTSSWNCAMQTLGLPKYGIIYKEQIL